MTAAVAAAAAVPLSLMPGAQEQQASSSTIKPLNNRQRRALRRNSPEAGSISSYWVPSLSNSYGAPNFSKRLTSQHEEDVLLLQLGAEGELVAVSADNSLARKHQQQENSRKAFASNNKAKKAPTATATATTNTTSEEAKRVGSFPSVWSSSSNPTAGQKSVLRSEDFLILTADPFGHAYGFFNPYVVREFKQARVVQINLSELQSIVDAAERVLLSLFGKTYKMTRGRTRKPHEIFFWANKSNVVESRKCCQLATRLLDETQHRRLSDLELRMLVSSLAIVLPPSHNFWIQLDELLSQHILRHGLSSMQLQTGLLCSHLIATACSAYNMPYNKFKTPHAVMRLLLDLCKPGMPLEEHFSAPHSLVEDVLAPIGVSRVEDSQQVEEAVLCAELLCRYKQDIIPNSSSSSSSSSSSKPLRTSWGELEPFLDAFAAHCQRILDFTPAPIKVATLRLLWEYLPSLGLPNTFFLYKSLYDQVRHSIVAEPLQLSGQEELIVSLLQSMQKSKFKNELLLDTLFETIKEQGARYEKVGIRLFLSLLELDCPGLATLVLSETMNKRVALGGSEDLDKQLFSFCSKEMSYDALFGVDSFLEKSTSGPYSSSDLSLALCCFGRLPEIPHVTKRHRFYRRLLIVEEEFLAKSLPSISKTEAVRVLYNYGKVGRIHPAIIRGTNAIIEPHLESLSAQDLSRLLWSNARLNHAPSFAKKASQLYLEAKDTIGNQQLHTLASTLWSMAVLRILTYEEYMKVEPQLLRHVNAGDGSETRPWMLHAMRQVLMELRLLHKNGSDATSSESVLDMRPWETSQKLMRINKEANITSYTHRHLSECLIRLGVDHVNEQTMEYGYVVDIFIPPPPPPPARAASPVGVDGGVVVEMASGTEASGPDLATQFWLHTLSPSDVNTANSGGGSSKGTIIEFDGPGHFDSFMMLQVLGPTAMKRRHLRELGYTLHSVPFWEFRPHFSSEEKNTYLRNLLSLPN